MNKSLILLVVGLASACGGSTKPAPADLAGSPDLALPSTSDASSPTDAAAPPLSIAPSSYTVPIGRSFTFVAAGATSFHVVESGGGTVDGSGVYTAPSTPGTYHVVASNGVSQGMATITVADFQLSLVAGKLGGFGGVDGVGSAARVGLVRNLVADGQGAYYFTDASSCSIRKLDGTTGTVTTIAGDPAECAVVDGTGATARFSMPHGLALDATNGVLYVTEKNEHVIRSLVLATGAVTTIAGQLGIGDDADGFGMAAKLDGPVGLAYDGQGTLYVAEAGGCTIRAIDVASQLVSTYAGQYGACSGTDAAQLSTATFRALGGIVFSGGELYVADGNAIRSVTTASGVVTIAGATTSGYTDMPGSAARFGTLQQITADGTGTLFVADDTNAAVRKVVIASGDVSTVAGGTVNGTGDLAFGQPYAIAYGSGTLIVGDGTYTLRGVALGNDSVNVLAGAPPHPGTSNGAFATATFNPVARLALANAQTLFLSDTYGGLVRVIDLGSQTTALSAGGSATVQDGMGSAAGFGAPLGLAVDAANNRVYLADGSAQQIRRITAPGGVVDTPFGTITPVEAGFANATGPHSQFYAPTDVVLLDGKLYVADSGNHAVRGIDLTVSTSFTVAGGNAGSLDGIGAAAEFDSVDAITTDGTNLFVFDGNSHTLREIELATGEVTTIAGQVGNEAFSDGIGTAATLGFITGLAYDGNGTLYFVDSQTALIRRIYLPTRAVSTFAGAPNHHGVKLGSIAGAQVGSPHGLVTTAPGTFYFVSECSILELAQQ